MPSSPYALDLRDRAVAPRCPYCHDQISPAPQLTCDTCPTTYHAECARSVGGRCVIRGCAGRAEPRLGWLGWLLLCAHVGYVLLWCTLAGLTVAGFVFTLAEWLLGTPL